MKSRYRERFPRQQLTLRENYGAASSFTLELEADHAGSS